MGNQCHALLPRQDGRPTHGGGALPPRPRSTTSSASLGTSAVDPSAPGTRQSVAHRSTGDLWHCGECPVIAFEGQVLLSAWDEERRKAELLAQPVRWFHYMSDTDHRRRTRVGSEKAMC